MISPNDPKEFFDCVQTFKPQVILSDFKFHDIMSIELLRRFRSSHPRVKLISFINQFTDDLGTFETESDGLLTSNCQLKELMFCITEVVAGRKYSVQFSELLSIDFDRSPEFTTLTRRERIILRHLSVFKTSTQIAGELSISQATVQAHKASIMKKLKLSGRNALLQFAFSLPQK
jgi:DNA-binding NarL/FixJ family response regulator